MSKINVVEDSDEPEFAHHRQKRLDYARAAERTSRNAANPHGFMDVFFEVHVEGMLQQPGVTMIVLRHHQNYSVCPPHQIGECRILHLFAGIIQPHRNLADVHEFSFHTGTLLRFFENETCRVFAPPSFARGAKNYRNKQRLHLRMSLQETPRRDQANLRTNFRSRRVVCSRSILLDATSRMSPSHFSPSAAGLNPFRRRKTIAAAMAVRLFPSRNGWLRQR